MLVLAVDVAAIATLLIIGEEFNRHGYFFPRSHDRVDKRSILRRVSGCRPGCLKRLSVDWRMSAFVVALLGGASTP
jgi:hypothetical protein